VRHDLPVQPRHVFRAGLPRFDGTFNRRGRWTLEFFRWVWIPACFVTPLILNLAVPDRFGFDLFRAFMGAALAPALLFLPGNRGPFRALFLQPPPLAILTEKDLELHLPGIGVRRYGWEEVASLTPGGPYEPGMLRGIDGGTLALVPRGLVLGRWKSLAQVVVRRRPDRYRTVRVGLFSTQTSFVLKNPGSTERPTGQ
jgi:hypothetical protein